MDESNIPTSEWSHFIEADTVESKGLKLDISPNAEERKNLSIRLGIQGVKDLKAHIELNRIRGNAVVHAKGTLSADVVQECVVTGKPVEEHVEDEFEGWYTDPESAISFSKARKEREAKKGPSEQPIMEEAEDPEAIINGQIDLGDLVTQYLSLALNPYPHAPGVKFEVGDDQEAQGRKRMDNPFEGLKEWKAKLTKGES